MRVSEIAPYIDLERIKIDTLKHLIQTLIRWEHPDRNHGTFYQQYGDELADLDAELKRLNLEKVRAEIRQSDAETALIKADQEQQESATTGAIMSGVTR